MRLFRVGIVATILLWSSVTGAANPLVGYGSSNAVLPAKNQELYYLGFEAGLIRILGTDPISGYVITSQISDGSPLGAVESVRKLIRQGVKIIAGYPTSHEAVLVGRITRRVDALTIFPSAGHSELGRLGNKIYTTGEPMRVTVSTMMDIANDLKGDTGRVLFVYNPEAVFSMNQHEELEKQRAGGRYGKLEADSVYLRPDLRMDDGVVDALRSGNYKCLMMTVYPDEAVELMKQLDENGIDIPIVTNSSWSTGDIEFLRRIIAHMNSPIYGYVLWLEESSGNRDIARYIQVRYGRKLTTEIVDGYDVGIIVGTVLKRMQLHHDDADALKAFREDPCFDGTSAGKMCFPSEGGHASRNVYKVKISKNGWTLMK